MLLWGPVPNFGFFLGGIKTSWFPITSNNEKLTSSGGKPNPKNGTDPEL